MAARRWDATGDEREHSDCQRAERGKRLGAALVCGLYAVAARKVGGRCARAQADRDVPPAVRDGAAMEERRPSRATAALPRLRVRAHPAAGPAACAEGAG